MMNIMIQLPEEIEERIQSLEKINFRLWMFIDQQGLLEEAQEFIEGFTQEITDELPFEVE